MLCWSTVRVPADAEPGVVFPIDARIDYLVCTLEFCVPETANVTVELRTGAPGARNPAFDGYRQALPRPMAERGAVRGRRADACASPSRSPPATALADPYFFPATADALVYGQPESDLAQRRSADRRGRAPARARRALQAIEGVLQLRAGAGLALTARPGPVPAAGTPVATRRRATAAARRARARASSLALLGALLGGLILNIMPCVFPILSLKALSLARAGESRKARAARGAGL